MWRNALMNDPYARLAEPFTRHYATIRGLIREELAARQLALHLPEPPADIADIGGGSGPQSIRLARAGHRVTLMDPSDSMLALAQQALAEESDEVRSRLRLIVGNAETAANQLGRAAFDVVLCQGVIMYVDDPAAVIAALGDLARPGAIVSLITKNADALAMRPALEGRFDDALRGFRADRDVGGMGVPTTAHSLEQLATWFTAAGCEIAAWYGIRVFTDHLGQQQPGADRDDILAAEWEAGWRDPYRHVARLIHLIARKCGPN